MSPLETPFGIRTVPFRPGSPACAAVANGRIVVVACADTTLHVFDSANGVRPLPPLVLKSPAAKLAVSAPALVMAITTSGHVGVWDIGKGKVSWRLSNSMCWKGDH
jgi:hypothetical protein